MIDTNKTIKQLVANGYGVVILEPTTLLTDAMTPLHIAGLEVYVIIAGQSETDRDSKPWKMATGTTDINEAMNIAKSRLQESCCNRSMLKAIMTEHTVI